MTWRRAGLTIVSGMARGIDSSAHQGACQAAHGATVGVLGTGVDVIYPKENKKLFAEVEKRGALISEFPLGTHPAPENFPVRNRVVAGMSLGIVVVQGAQYSGSLITARLGMEFGREVYGVSRKRHGRTSALRPNQIDQTGRQTGDLLGRRGRGTAHGNPRRAVSRRGDDRRRACVSICGGAFAAWRKRYLVCWRRTNPSTWMNWWRRSELNSSEVLAALCEMEMKGMVRQMPGKQFIKVLL